MNDQQLKDLLNKDQSMPNRPVNEWNSIESKIAKDNSFNLNILKNKAFLGLVTASLVIFIAIPTIMNTSKINSSESENLASYLLDDDYLSDSSSSYAWIDNEL